MAVAKMKHITISGPIEMLDDVVHACIINQEFHPENAINVMDRFKGFFPFEQDNPYTEPLRRISAISSRAGIALDYQKFEGLDLSLDAVEEYLETFEGGLGRMAARRDELERLKAEDLQILNQLSHIKDINITANLEEFFDLGYARFRFGRMPKEVAKSLAVYVEGRPDVYFYETGRDGGYIYGMYIIPRAVEEQVDAIFLSLHFERIFISQRVHGTPAEAIEMIRVEINGSEEKAAALQKQIDEFKNEWLDKLLACYSYVRYMNDSFDIRRYAGHTEKNFYVMGWMPSDAVPGLERGLAEFPDVDYHADAPEGLGYPPPSKIVNRGPAKLFEPFTAMYGLPSYDEFDPTPVIAIIYTVLFGVMFGDVGQGLLVILVGALMWRLKGAWMGRVLTCTGTASVCFGFIYGSFFGDEEFLAHALGYHPFRVLESSANTTRILLTVVFAGIGIVTSAMLINIANGFRQKNYEKALFAVNGLAGLVLYWAIVLAILPMMGFAHGLRGPVFTGCCVVLPLALIFLRQPLGKLAARDPDWMPENIGDFILENLFEMVEAALSYVTNSISFLRVGAFAISHAGMMIVVYQLAGGAWMEGGNPIVIIVGNLFVAGLEGLLVGIQTLRLMYYELFSRFYAGGGKPFSPMVIEYRLREAERIG